MMMMMMSLAGSKQSGWMPWASCTVMRCAMSSEWAETVAFLRVCTVHQTTHSSSHSSSSSSSPSL
eukprot:4965810-Karenia_brevis.AAC.1